MSSAEELKKKTLAGAKAECKLIRKKLVETVTKNGGHLASNLGCVEISVGIARVFSLPYDKVIYDTGHQSYVHKIISDREDKFSTLRTHGGISGFPSRAESVYDAFGTGHSGTGISAALGFAKAARLDGNSAWSIAVIGDGAFSGGEVFEALNNISPRDRIIIILNDNKMSISGSVGALKSVLNRMRSEGYYRAKDNVRSALSKVPGVGDSIAQAMHGIKNSLKRNVFPEGNLFEQYGLDYYGPADGNDLGKVEFLLSQAKKNGRPSIIHLCTVKGKGYPPAEADPTSFHGISPTRSAEKDFSEHFGDEIVKKASSDKDIVAVTAAMTDGVGLAKFSAMFPDRFFDVGIAEEHAMTFSASLAAAGKKPVFAVYSTFFQRCFDQFIHDAALQKLPVVVCLDRAGIVGSDGATHHGLEDVSLTGAVPGVFVYSPCTFAEFDRYFSRALAEKEAPSVIRYPKGGEDELIKEYFSGTADTEKAVFGGGENVIVTHGRLTREAIKAALILEKEGVGVTVVRYGVIKGSEETEFLCGLSPKKAVFAEEGVRRGSFAEHLVSRLAEKGIWASVPKKTVTSGDTFIRHGTVAELFTDAGISAEQIAEAVRNGN